jgi:hypothetical protein
MRAVFCGSGIKVPSDTLSVSLCPHQPSRAMPWGPEPQTGRAPNLDLYCTCMWVHKRSSATRVFGGLTRVWHIRGRQVRVLFPDRRHGQGACRTPVNTHARETPFFLVSVPAAACSAEAAPRAFLCLSGISVVSFLRVAQKHLPPHHLLPLAQALSLFLFFCFPFWRQRKPRRMRTTKGIGNVLLRARSRLQDHRILAPQPSRVWAPLSHVGQEDRKAPGNEQRTRPRGAAFCCPPVFPSRPSQVEPSLTVFRTTAALLICSNALHETRTAAPAARRQPHMTVRQRS